MVSDTEGHSGIRSRPSTSIRRSKVSATCFRYSERLSTGDAGAALAKKFVPTSSASRTSFVSGITRRSILRITRKSARRSCRPSYERTRTPDSTTSGSLGAGGRTCPDRAVPAWLSRRGTSRPAAPHSDAGKRRSARQVRAVKDGHPAGLSRACQTAWSCHGTRLPSSTTVTGQRGAAPGQPSRNEARFWRSLSTYASHWRASSRMSA